MEIDPWPESVDECGWDLEAPSVGSIPESHEGKEEGLRGCAPGARCDGLPVGGQRVA